MDNPETLATLGTRMDNPETLATLGKQNKIKKTPTLSYLICNVGTNSLQNYSCQDLFSNLYTQSIFSIT
jgi:hypothetical protein